jgi:DNA-binding NtrC family response regulator
MDLRRAAAEGTFREDLLYRLEVLQLSLPPLRQRREDIPELVSHFLEMARRNFGCDVRAFEDDALEVLCSYAWPGNIRELKNVVAQAAVMSDRDVVSAHHLPRRMRPPAHEEALEPTSEEAYDQAFPSAEPATPAERQPAPEPSSAKPEPPAPAQDGVFIPVGATLEEVQEAYIRKVLEQCSGNKTQAAKTLGISRKTLYERLKRWDDEA